DVAFHDIDHLGVVTDLQLEISGEAAVHHQFQPADSRAFESGLIDLDRIGSDGEIFGNVEALGVGSHVASGLCIGGHYQDLRAGHNCAGGISNCSGDSSEESLRGCGKDA